MNNMKENDFYKQLELLNIVITDDIINKLKSYYTFLVEYNKKVNLTTITDYEEVLEKHFYDSISIVKIIDLNNISNMIDVGTGAGFPGVILSIFFPNIKITLLDSNNKKTTFLKELIKHLELKNIEIVLSRSEDYAKQNREKYDLVVARAVKRLNILSELCLPLVKKNGYFIAMKGQLTEELDESIDTISILGGKIINKEIFNLPNEKSIRTLLLVQKIINTPNLYPREYSQIMKKPLIISNK